MSLKIYNLGNKLKTSLVTAFMLLNLHHDDVNVDKLSSNGRSKELMESIVVLHKLGESELQQ